MSTVFLPLAKMLSERYFDRMITINDILDVIDRHERLTGETMTELSRRVTGKKDTIRNWRRSREEGIESSASFQNVQAILAAIGTEVKLGDTSPLIRSDEEILSVLKRIEGLDSRGVEVAFSVISNHLRVNQPPRSSQGVSDGQSETANPRRESSSSQ
jgi:hypothetical protein